MKSMKEALSMATSARHDIVDADSAVIRVLSIWDTEYYADSVEVRYTLLR